jgi:hypothetical protein
MAAVTHPAPINSQTTPISQPTQNLYNGLVKWTAYNTLHIVENLTTKDAHGFCKKTMIIFASILPLILLVPCAMFVATAKFIWRVLTCQTSTAPTAPPAQPPASQPAPTAQVPAAVVQPAQPPADAAPAQPIIPPPAPVVPGQAAPPANAGIVANPLAQEQGAVQQGRRMGVIHMAGIPFEAPLADGPPMQVMGHLEDILEEGDPAQFAAEAAALAAQVGHVQNQVQEIAAAAGPAAVHAVEEPDNIFGHLEDIFNGDVAPAVQQPAAAAIAAQVGQPQNQIQLGADAEQLAAAAQAAALQVQGDQIQGQVQAIAVDILANAPVVAAAGPEVAALAGAVVAAAAQLAEPPAQPVVPQAAAAGRNPITASAAPAEVNRVLSINSLVGGLAQRLEGNPAFQAAAAPDLNRGGSNAWSEPAETRPVPLISPVFPALGASPPSSSVSPVPFVPAAARALSPTGLVTQPPRGNSASPLSPSGPFVVLPPTLLRAASTVVSPRVPSTVTALPKPPGFGLPAPAAGSTSSAAASATSPRNPSLAVGSLASPAGFGMPPSNLLGESRFPDGLLVRRWGGAPPAPPAMPVGSSVVSPRISAPVAPSIPISFGVPPTGSTVVSPPAPPAKPAVNLNPDQLTLSSSGSESGDALGGDVVLSPGNRMPAAWLPSESDSSDSSRGKKSLFGAKTLREAGLEPKDLNREVSAPPSSTSGQAGATSEQIQQVASVVTRARVERKGNDDQSQYGYDMGTAGSLSSVESSDGSVPELVASSRGHARAKSKKKNRSKIPVPKAGNGAASAGASNNNQGLRAERAAMNVNPPAARDGKRRTQWSVLFDDSPQKPTDDRPAT